MRNILTFLAILFVSNIARADDGNPADHNTWAVTANNYQYSMTITTALVFDMEESRDVNDKIAAFVGSDCRGVAKPITYVPESDRYLAHLLVYGNVVEGDTITLYMYDASENEIIQVADKLVFAPNATYGTVADPYMAITTFDVTINVNSGGESVPGAFVTLGDYGSRYSDEDGNAIFENIAPSDEILYSVFFEGYDKVDKSLAVNNVDVVENVELSCTYIFNVSDGENPVVNAKISLDSYGSLLTDDTGEASFSNLIVSDSVYYKVELDAYNFYEDSISVDPLKLHNENIIINLTRYNIDFYVTNNGEIVSNATISLSGYGEKITDENGYVQFEGVLPSEGIEYSINSSIHDNHTNSVAVVDENIVLNIDLNLTGFKVEFSIIDGNIPVENARVHLDGYDIKTSDVYGNVVFDKVILDDEITYEVISENYNLVAGSISVVDSDISEKVSLRLSTYNAVFNVTDGIKSIEGTEIEIEIAGDVRIEDFDNAIIPDYFKSRGNSVWNIDDVDEFQGVHIIKSGEVFDNQFSEISFDKKTIAGEFSFFMKVSSELDHDYLIFYIDGEEKGRWSGDTDWKHQTYVLESGTHNFKWEYKKDGSRKDGNDCSWIDYIKYPSEEMSLVNLETDVDGIAIFTNLLPRDVINYKVKDSRYSAYENNISIVESNQEEEISLKVDLGFNIIKEFDGEYMPTDSIVLDNYGKMLFDDNGYAEFKNVDPTEVISYSIYCDRYNDVYGDIGALVNNSISTNIDITRYNVEFNAVYNDSPISDLEVVLENNGKLITNENGNVVFENVVPANLIYEIDHFDFLYKTGIVELDDKDLNLSVEILPVYYLEFNVESGANTGQVPVYNATITLDESGMTLNTGNTGEVEFDEMTPDNEIKFTVEADGYYSHKGTTQIIHSSGNEGSTISQKVVLKLNPNFEASNFISPNSDGINDKWEIYDAEKYYKFTVEIYTTSGEMVFETKNYGDNKWDGKNDGKDLPNGIYYYIVTSPAMDIVFKGVINLVN